LAVIAVVTFAVPSALCDWPARIVA
jgi:hypothetical protein